ncbi:sigma-54 dependent transcriptional regulator [Candidatus Igneacidithiobacillus taiwanensis]|uniref:sigma-54-dependent transcriptional regulator n=1 Tax=Candidatus Igneacidithiobacillus taiwanensis TaxID=1945924 RepID=UPI002897B3BC|nr:sigma-54 dependent transcriptional regulator [Candidatus Igneacidithiobacillus taiwanensis]
MGDPLLIVEDEIFLGREMRRFFEKEGWQVFWAERLADAEQLLAEELNPLVTLADLNLPDGNSLDLLERSRERGQQGEWIFLTAYGSVPDSVRALRLGAYDFLEKPCEMERLAMVVRSAGRAARAQRRVADDTNQHSRRYSPAAFLGTSPAAQRVREILQRLAQVPYSGLIISGETGTGKGLAARILHYSGLRSDGPMVEINCAALPRELLESELFGYEAGAFTGATARHRGLVEQASGGSLFLDEISEMDLDLQAKLLKVIEDRSLRRLGGDRTIQVDVRFLAASNRDLDAMVAEGRFRADLYHRLSVVRLLLPALRERKEDLQELVPHFVAEFNAQAGKRVRHISPAVWQSLEQYDWPGNVRELRNVVERGVLFSEGEDLPLEWLQLPGMATVAHCPAPGACPLDNRQQVVLPLDGSMDLDSMEREIIARVLQSTDHNVTQAARILGTTRETLRYRIRKYGLGSDEG